MRKHFGYDPEKFDYTFQKKSGLTSSLQTKIKTNESPTKAGSTHQKLSLFTLNVRTCPPLKHTYFLSKNKIEES